MSDHPSSERDRLRDALHCELNEHGFALQHSLLRLLSRLTSEETGDFKIEAVEAPVRLGDSDTRIDFVLRLDSEPPVFLIVECKRVNPAFADWCFLRAAGAPKRESLILERVNTIGQTPLNAYASRTTEMEPTYHVAIEVKNRTNKGDSQAKNKAAIEPACGQVMLGVNGFVEALAGVPDMLLNRSGAVLIPAIVTTAKLWGCDAGLDSASLTTGSVAKDSLEPTERPWLFYQYHPSVSLRHKWQLRSRFISLRGLVEMAWRRSIAVVQAERLPEFLRSIRAWQFQPQ